MKIFQALCALWHGFNDKKYSTENYIQCSACGLIRPKTQPKCECQSLNDSPLIVEMVQEESGIIAKLSLAPGGREKLIKNLSSPTSYGNNNKINLTINSRTSPGIIYQVTFNNNNGIIDIKCNCPAGELTKLCWHKLALARGDSSMLLDYDLDDFRLVQKWFKNSPFNKLIADHDKAQEIVSEGQKVLKKLKAKIEVAMREGI